MFNFQQKVFQFKQIVLRQLDILCNFTTGLEGKSLDTNMLNFKSKIF